MPEGETSVGAVRQETGDKHLWWLEDLDQEQLERLRVFYLVQMERLTKERDRMNTYYTKVVRQIR